MGTISSVCPEKGMIFLEHGVCDIGLDTVEWTREWLAKVGEERLQR